jgi:hypothetical protein
MIKDRIGLPRFNSVGRKVVIVISMVAGLGLFATLTAQPVPAYPPAVGIVDQARNCLDCHVDNGPWKDDSSTIIDILDKATGESLIQDDGSFLIAAKRGETRTVLTVLGRAAGDDVPAPYRNGWVYISPDLIGSSSVSKFVPGWEVNLQMGCRLMGDKQAKYPGANITVASMALRPGEDAEGAAIELQVMLTSGESVKGKPREGMTASYFMRQVRLEVIK